MTGKLYVVGTPIGNLDDISKRALETLSQVDFIAAEDTRVTLKLLNRFGIKKELVSYYEHNKEQKGEIIISRILSGESCAVVTDAGMPAVSDPGQDLVLKAHESSVEVVAVPGPCAFVTALAVSGMPSGRFCFEGFLSVNRPNRIKHLESLKDEERTIIFYEAPHKLLNTLKDMYDAFGDRRTAVVKELTKIHETVFNTTLSQAPGLFENQPPRGEFVIIIEGARKTENQVCSLEEAAETARRLMKDGLSASAAAKQASYETGVKKGEIYKLIALKQG